VSWGDHRTPTKKQLKRLERQNRRRRRRTVAWSVAVAALAAALIVAYMHLAASPPVNPSDRAQSFSGFPLTLVNGTTINTGSLRGHPLLVWLVTTWCSSCAESQQLLASEYYPLLHSKGIIIVEVENYDDLGEQGPSLRQFIDEYGGANMPGWLIGTAPQWVTEKYNPDQYLDIFYLVSQNGLIVGQNVGLGAYLGSIIQDFSAAPTSQGSGANLTAYIGQTVSQQLYSSLVDASKPYPAPTSSIYNAFEPISGPTLSVDGKPIILYIGAEYCPYCAAARWPLILALLRFGNFTGLQYMLSSSKDVYPDTPTFSFVDSKYYSPYIVFDSYEYMDRNYEPLQAVPPNYSTIWQAAAQGSIPFVDFGGRVAMVGAPFSPAILGPYNWTQILNQIQLNTSVGQPIEAAANAITQQICRADGGNPASVCGATPIEDLSAPPEIGRGTQDYAAPGAEAPSESSVGGTRAVDYTSSWFGGTIHVLGVVTAETTGMSPALCPKQLPQHAPRRLNSSIHFERQK
jgi:thiol-disulfide isomerase/thioredoxin